MNSFLCVCVRVCVDILNLYFISLVFLNRSISSSELEVTGCISLGFSGLELGVPSSNLNPQLQTREFQTTAISHPNLELLIE